MCNAFSAIVMKNTTVYWQAGIDSHDDLCSMFELEGKDESNNSL